MPYVIPAEAIAVGISEVEAGRSPQLEARQVPKNPREQDRGG